MNYIEINFHNIFNLKIYWLNNKLTNIKIMPLKKVAERDLKLPDFIDYTIYYLNNYYNLKNEFALIECLDFSKKSIFQQNIYTYLSNIKFGKTITYSELAEKAGYKNAQRAVGTAMKKNCFPIIIPCHRVLSKNSIGGYSFGIEYKKELLKRENILISIY